MGAITVYGEVLWGVESDSARSTRNETIAVATEAYSLRSHRSNRNKIRWQFCVERSVHVEAIATREVGAPVHGRSDTEEPLSATRA